jgi:transcriptional regulator with XRE-family HTH domain
MPGRPESVERKKMADQAAVFGRRLDEILRRKGWDIARLEREMDVTWTTASRWRKGRVLPKDPDTWVRLCAVLHVTPWELMPFALDYEPPFKAWQDFRATPEGMSLTDRQRISLAWHYFPPEDGEPTVGTYQLMLAAQRSLQPRTYSAE